MKSKYYVRTDYLVPVFGRVLKRHDDGSWTVKAFSPGCIEGETGPEVPDEFVHPLGKSDFDCAKEKGWEMSLEDVEVMLGEPLPSQPTWRWSATSPENVFFVKELLLFRQKHREFGVPPEIIDLVMSRNPGLIFRTMKTAYSEVAPHDPALALSSIRGCITLMLQVYEAAEKEGRDPSQLTDDEVQKKGVGMILGWDL